MQPVAMVVTGTSPITTMADELSARPVAGSMALATRPIIAGFRSGSTRAVPVVPSGTALDITPPRAADPFDAGWSVTTATNRAEVDRLAPGGVWDYECWYAPIGVGAGR